jgi:hypothetical protein
LNIRHNLIQQVYFVFHSVEINFISIITHNIHNEILIVSRK